jgi:RNA ligase
LDSNIHPFLFIRTVLADGDCCIDDDVVNMFNAYQENLYNDLLRLSETNEAFFFKDFECDGVVYRIFNYRLASYTDFLEPGALECRGIMFEIEPAYIDSICSRPASPVRLASLPMEKFFNLNENPMTMNLDLTKVKSVELKADGSLISTYRHNDEIRLKTKGSVESEQCIAAMKWVDERPEFKHALTVAEELGYTVNMEWCAPDNRIVLGYEEPQLTVLNFRRRHDGGYFDIFTESCKNNPTFDVLRENHIERLDVKDPVEFVASIPRMEGVEGYVVELDCGHRVKVKTEWYLVQHRAKDSINSPRRLFEACIEEATDDLRSLFFDDPVAIAMIEEMEKFAEHHYNHTVDQVERFYERNKNLERKDYAILGQKELDKRIFGLAMSKYLGREVDYKAFMRKNYKAFGVADDPVED